MAQLAKGIVSGEMAWGLLGIGLALGVALIFIGARAPMLIAVGMYLPFETSAAIFVGGMMKTMCDRWAANRGEEERARIEEKGTLVASGLIAGEAIIGILLAATFLAGIPPLTRLFTGTDEFSWYGALGGWTSIAAFAAIGFALIRVPLRR
jgi:uncharacterized oligopeptide transporter (OPT) family protein